MTRRPLWLDWRIPAALGGAAIVIAASALLATSDRPRDAPHVTRITRIVRPPTHGTHAPVPAAPAASVRPHPVNAPRTRVPAPRPSATASTRPTPKPSPTSTCLPVLGVCVP